jgi:hypothetical protein
MKVGRAQRVAVLGAAVVCAAIVLVVVLGTSRDDQPSGDPRDLIWRHKAATIGGGGVFEPNQFAPMSDRVFAIASVPLLPALDRWRGSLVSSTDGFLWAPVEGPIAAVSLNALASIDGVAWAFGQVDGPAEPEHQVWRSEDGTTWERVAGVSGLDFGKGEVWRVAGVGSTVVVVARAWIDVESHDGLVLRSDDGRDWELVKQPRGPSYGLRSLDSGPAGFVITFAFEDPDGTSRGEAWHSLDGRTWTQNAIQTPRQGFNAFQAAGGPIGFSIVGFAADDPKRDWQPAAWTSPNGLVWQRASTVDPTGPTTGAMHAVVSISPGYMAFGNAGALDADRPAAWRSGDGQQWARLLEWPASLAPHESVDGAVAWNDRILVTGTASDGTGPDKPVIWLGEPVH